MRITIAANVYPPEIGGPSEYARQLFDTLLIQNHHVSVVYYGVLKKFPTGLRHFLYGIKLLIDAFDADYIIALDSYSVGLPAMVFAVLFGKKIVVRIAGDFLWEKWVDRTGEQVLLSEFYSAKRTFTLKEKIIFWLSRDVLRSADAVVFSTEWQKNLMMDPYELSHSKIRIVENFYPPVVATDVQGAFSEKIFLSPSRNRAIKNKNALEKAWEQVKIKHTDVLLDTNIVAHEVLLEKISRCHAVIVPSLSEVSPNMILDALSCNVPSLVTKDTGIADRLQGMAVFIDPRSVDSIAQGIESLLDQSMYETYRKALNSRTFVHSWNQIAQEFIDIYRTL